MGTDATEQEDYRDGLTRCGTTEFDGLVDRIGGILHLLDVVPVTEHTLYSSCCDLMKALARFQANRGRWTRMTEADVLLLQKHMVFTLMVPGGRADKARTAVERLEGIYHVLPVADDLVFTPEKETDVFNAIGGWVRFPRQKADRVVLALANWQGIRTALAAAVRLNEPVPALRKQVMKMIKGYGKKAASHFMRNTGLMCGWNALPIIDTHIHKALESLNFRHDGYEEAESSYSTLAQLVQVPPLYLDAVLWCAYSKNWDITHSDFDNFNYQ